ncbi:hypothetical protein H9639_12385 [Arthrobacter sp. Sa2CUA1]|uniref:HTH luxR-type domain-containing protein n=1 Tax=Arthrobacter gallicola TaxID=2762225 RepID=A0ABR8UU68_9MICC|nr:LuxR C-terminal-related transcriptional regulator [Arthrobacter gallicola]MBD7996097.1 hypothetical protein [Arthrobacter gallicola]
MQSFASQPMVGRDDDVQAVLASLRSQQLHGALVVAEAGLGKSALAQVVVGVLETSMPVHRVHASSALTGIPYGALAPLLPDLSARDTGSPLAVMRALLQRLRPESEPATGEIPLVVVDDAHALDEASADLLSQLLASGTIRVLILTRSITAIPAGIPDQVWSGIISRHHLAPLTEEQVHELCRQILDGPLLSTTSGELARVSGGNPMFVQALVAETRRTGNLVQHNGVWLLEDFVHPPQGRLGDLLKAQLSGLSVEERETMEIIALAEPLPVGVAFRLGLHRSVDALTAAKLVSVEDAGQRLLRPRHPLYGEVVRHMVPAARSARLRQRVHAVLPERHESMDGLLRSVAWSLDCGAPVPDEQLLRAAYMANNFFDTTFALRAAGEVRRKELLPAAGVQAARAHYQCGNYEAARDLVSGTVEAAIDLTTAKMGTLLTVQICQRLDGGGTKLRAPLRSWQEAVERIEAAARAAGTFDQKLEAEAVSSRRGVKLLGLLIDVAEGHYRTALTHLPGLLEESRQAEDLEATAVALALLGDVYTATGRAETAVNLTREALMIVTGNDHRFLSYHHFVLHRHLSALLWAGYWEEVRSCVHQKGGITARALVHTGGAVDFCFAVMHLRRGQLGEARPKLAAAVEGLRGYDPEGLLPLALALSSHIAAHQGDLALADQLLQDYDQLEPRGSVHEQTMAAGNRIACTYRRTNDPRALKDLRDLADQAEERGLLAAEFDLRTIGMRMGDPAGLSRLLKLSDDFQGPYARAVNAFARGVLDQDVPALLRLASDPADYDTEALGPLALQEALRLARASGDRAQIQRVQRAVGKTSEKTAGQRKQPAAPSLTRREKDVAALVLKGYRNAEIAERLFLSVRTVEGHIYRTFEKLGISKRDELSAELLGE